MPSSRGWKASIHDVRAAFPIAALAAPAHLASECAAGRCCKPWGYATRNPGEQPCPRNILLIRPDHLGDLLFVTPGLHALRTALPDARLTLLVGPWNLDVVRDNPDVDAILTCPFPGFERRPKADALAPYRLLTETAKQLRGEAFDAALILRFDHWWGAWLAAEAGIPARIGYDVPETRPFLTEPVAYTADRHEVLQNTRLLHSGRAERGRCTRAHAFRDFRARYRMGNGLVARSRRIGDAAVGRDSSGCRRGRQAMAARALGRDRPPVDRGRGRAGVVDGQRGGARTGGSSERQAGPPRAGRSGSNVAGAVGGAAGALSPGIGLRFGAAAPRRGR